MRMIRSRREKGSCGAIGPAGADSLRRRGGTPSRNETARRAMNAMNDRNRMRRNRISDLFESPSNRDGTGNFCVALARHRWRLNLNTPRSRFALVCPYQPEAYARCFQSDPLSDNELTLSREIRGISLICANSREERVVMSAQNFEPRRRMQQGKVGIPTIPRIVL